MLFVGIQFFVWSFSGLYMVMLNIHYIHGENYLKSNLATLPTSSVGYDINTLLQQYPQASKIRLAWLHDRVIYRFNVAGETKMVDASSGLSIGLLTNELAAQIATGLLQEPMPISQVTLITDNLPSEIGRRGLPLWQVQFEGLNSVTLYISQKSGELMYTRHNAWRGFDLLWRLHIMDYTEGEDINNILLNVFNISGILAVFAGTLLLYLRLFKNRALDPVS
jgi:hypothetical protein